MVGVALPATAAEYEDAQKLLLAQKWNEALPILKQLNDEDPTSVVVAKDLAQVLLRLNRREESLELLRHHHLSKYANVAAKSFLSKDSFRFYQQGLDWLVKRSYPQACERFEKALEKDQAHFDILFHLSQCEILDGNAELGLKLFNNFERVHGKSNESSLWRARALALRGRFEEAFSLFSMNSLVKNPEPLVELNALWWGEALLAAGMKNQALVVFENDAKRFPSHLQTTLALLKLRAQSGESPNQFLAINRDLMSWEKSLTALNGVKKPRVIIDLFDSEALQRTANELKILVRSRLPSPHPSTSAFEG